MRVRKGNEDSVGFSVLESVRLSQMKNNDLTDKNIDALLFPPWTGWKGATNYILNSTCFGSKQA